MKITVIRPEDMYEGVMNLELVTNTYKGDVTFGGGEPEDNCLARDLNDAFRIEIMLNAAYIAGKEGEPYEVERIKGDYRDF